MQRYAEAVALLERFLARDSQAVDVRNELDRLRRLMKDKQFNDARTD